MKKTLLLALALIAVGCGPNPQEELEKAGAIERVERGPYNGLGLIFLN